MKSRPIQFYSRGTKIVGELNLPDDYHEGTQLPCVIPCSGYTGIAAAYPALLSRLFTKNGYATVIFDYRGWAPSDGERGHTTAEDEYFDIEAAYIFAQQQPEIQAENVALFGWGFSAPVVLKLAANYPEIKAVGCGNGVYNGERSARTLLSWEDYQALKKIAREDLIQRVLTGKGTMTPAYEQVGHARAYQYLSGNLEPLTLAGMTKNEFPQYNANADGDEDSMAGSFMDVDGADEAILKNWGGKHNFPPMHSFEYTDSELRVDVSGDICKISPRPIFIVHAEGDRTYPVSEAYAVINEIGTNCTSCIVGGDHNDFMFDNHPEFKHFSRAIIAFYDKVMK